MRAPAAAADPPAHSRPPARGGCGRSPRPSWSASSPAGQRRQPSSQLHGPEGLLRVIEQLEGLELAGAIVGSATSCRERVHGYDPRLARRAVPRRRGPPGGHLTPSAGRGPRARRATAQAGEVAPVPPRPRADPSSPRAPPQPTECPHLSQLAREVTPAMLEHRGLPSPANPARDPHQRAGQDDLEEGAEQGSPAAASDLSTTRFTSPCAHSAGTNKPAQRTPRRLLRGRWSLPAQRHYAMSGQIKFGNGGFGPAGPPAYLHHWRASSPTRLLPTETGAPAVAPPRQRSFRLPAPPRGPCQGQPRRPLRRGPAGL